jgi:hypothetical protein
VVAAELGSETTLEGVSASPSPDPSCSSFEFPLVVFPKESEEIDSWPCDEDSDDDDDDERNIEDDTSARDSGSDMTEWLTRVGRAGIGLTESR